MLNTLIDARLLTSFELRGEDGGPTRRVEVVHESLLRAWPRLVRWQAQDAEGALLRDQLRQAAHLWEEKGRPDDLLWTGTSYREYAVWRERYPGALSSLEEAYAAAMVSLATRRRRQRRVAAVVGVSVLLAVLTVVTTLWRRSVQQTRRAEAANLLAVAQARLADDPTEALALAAASLEVADLREAREFVMRVLWTAPPALEFNPGEDQLQRASFSPDGRSLAVTSFGSDVTVWPEDGRGPVRLDGHRVSRDGGVLPVWAADDLLVTGWWMNAGATRSGDRVRVWSIPDGKLLRVIDLGPREGWKVGSRRLFGVPDEQSGAGAGYLLRSWRLPDGEAELLDTLSAAEMAGISDLVPAPDGSGWVVARGNAVWFRPFGGGGPERLLETLEAGVSLRRLSPSGVLARDEAGNASLWSFGEGGPRRAWAIRGPAGAATALPDQSGRRVASLEPGRHFLQLRELGGLPGARPLELRRTGVWYLPDFDLHPTGDWCVATTLENTRLAFWPLARGYPSVVEGYKFSGYARTLAFSPDSRWLATGWQDGGVRLLPVEGGEENTVRQLRPPVDGLAHSDIDFDPQGRYLFVVFNFEAWLVPLDGGAWLPVVPRDPARQLLSGAVSPSGALVAAAFFGGEGERTISVFEVATGALRSLPLPATERPGEITDGIISLEFLDEQTLLTAGVGGIRRWDLATGSQQLVAELPQRIGMLVGRASGIAIAGNPFTYEGECLSLIDLATGAGRPLHGFGCWGLPNGGALDPSENVFAIGNADGSVRVGRLDGGDPHLLVGHTGAITRLAMSPDLRWVATAGDDNTLRLWPMPDLDAPPLHTLPHDELLAKLHSLTNFRAVRDPASPGGRRIVLGPFPGWRDIPTW